VKAARVLALGLAALLAAAAARGDDACADCRYTGALAELFVAARALGPGWETLREAPTDPQADADLRAAGVRAVHALHYTLERQGGSDVCSVELWGFASPVLARGARGGMERDGWRVATRGNLLVMVHGVTLRRGQGMRQGLLHACHRLADLTLERVGAALRAPTAGASPTGAAPR
jgi:hypothetical protein